VPLEQNAFLYASVPGRLVLATLAAIRAGMDAGDEEGSLSQIAAFDGFGAISLG